MVIALLLAIILEVLWFLTTLTPLTKQLVRPHGCMQLAELWQEAPALLVMLVRIASDVTSNPDVL